MTVEPEFSASVARPKKRMMSVEWEMCPVTHMKKRPIVSINFSSLELLQT